ncbi:MAG: response regulator, partial [Nitrospirae bacterium]
DPLFITDREFNILRANRAFHEFVGTEEVIGKKCYEITHGKNKPENYCPHLDTLLTGESSLQEFYDEEKNRFLLYTTSLIKHQNGKELIIHHIKDITFLKSLEKERDSLLSQLLQAQKMEAVGSLAGGIAHDFNNILTGIMGHAELAEMKLPPDSPVRKNIAVIKEASDKAKDFIKQLLLFGKKTQIERKVQDLNTLLKDSLKLIKKMLGEHITLEFEPSAEPLYAYVDSAQFTQVIINLAVNARDAMPEGGTLTIGTEREAEKGKDFVLVRVSDTGSGIPEEYRQRIFEPFFTTKPEGKGTGLGLSVVYSVIERHGGFIEVDSEINRGTTFKIYLPDSGSSTVHIPDGSDGSEELPCGEESILLVDDEEMIRSTGRMILENLGYQVTTAQNGREALEIFRSDPDRFDLVLSDLIMPEMRGTVLYRELKRIRPDVKFVLITGYGIHEVPPELRGEFHAVVEKPFRTTELARVLRDVIDS